MGFWTVIYATSALSILCFILGGRRNAGVSRAPLMLLALLLIMPTCFWP